jgi:hypothetical protein
MKVSTKMAVDIFLYRIYDILIKVYGHCAQVPLTHVQTYLFAVLRVCLKHLQALFQVTVMPGEGR